MIHDGNHHLFRWQPRLIPYMCWRFRRRRGRVARWTNRMLVGVNAYPRIMVSYERQINYLYIVPYLALLHVLRSTNFALNLWTEFWSSIVLSLFWQTERIANTKCGLNVNWSNCVRGSKRKYGPERTPAQFFVLHLCSEVGGTLEVAAWIVAVALKIPREFKPRLHHFTTWYGNQILFCCDELTFQYFDCPTQLKTHWCANEARFVGYTP